MAEFMFKKMVKDAGLTADFLIDSAAVSTEEIGHDMYPPAQKKLLEKGVPFEARRARQITAADYEKFDVICAMDVKISIICSACGTKTRRIKCGFF